MIETGLISLLGGAVARLLTWGSEYFTKKQENTHELELLDKQMELSKLQAEQKITEISVQTNADIDTTWAEALKAATTPVVSGVRFVDALSASVRPVLTYFWCLLLYTGYKLCLIYLSFMSDATIAQTSTIIITDFDTAVIGSMLSFWFLDRQLRKASTK